MRHSSLTSNFSLCHRTAPSMNPELLFRNSQSVASCVSQTINPTYVRSTLQSFCEPLKASGPFAQNRGRLAVHLFENTVNAPSLLWPGCLKEPIAVCQFALAIGTAQPWTPLMMRDQTVLSQQQRTLVSRELIRVWSETQSFGNTLQLHRHTFWQG